MIKTLTVLAAVFAAASATCAGENRTCLEIYLWDTFGDDWDDSKLWVEMPDGSIESDAPDCDTNPVVHSLCSDESGKFYMVNNRADGGIPEEYWEIFWTVTVKTCEDKETFYTGGWNTTMVWDYNADTDMWSLEYWDSVWPNKEKCEGCGDAEACKPKPKPKPKKKPEKPVPVPMNNTNITDIEAPKFGPPAVDVSVVMFAEDKEGWFEDNYHGANWYIYNCDRLEIFHHGTLCKKEKGKCQVCLGDGSYLYRVTGMENNFTSWDFCGVTGGYQDELSFHVEKGKCIPDMLRSIDQMCDMVTTAEVFVTATVALTGIPVEILSEENVNVIFNTFHSEVNELSVDKMHLVSSTLDSRSPFTAERKLNTYTHDVTFTLSFDASDFGVDVTAYHNLKQLVNNMHDVFAYKMYSGLFVKDLSNLAVDSPLMSSVQGAELITFAISSVSYSHTEKFEYSTLPSQQEESTMTKYVSKFDTASVIVFFAALAVGFVAFVGIMSRGMSGYKTVPQESAHGSMDVLPSESEHPLAQPAKVSRFEIGKVEATI